MEDKLARAEQEKILTLFEQSSQLFSDEKRKWLASMLELMKKAKCEKQRKQGSVEQKLAIDGHYVNVEYHIRMMFKTNRRVSDYSLNCKCSSAEKTVLAENAKEMVKNLKGEFEELKKHLLDKKTIKRVLIRISFWSISLFCIENKTGYGEEELSFERLVNWSFIAFLMLEKRPTYVDPINYFNDGFEHFYKYLYSRLLF